MATARAVDLSVVIPALNEGANLALLLPQVAAVLRDLQVAPEILIVSPALDPITREAAESVSAKVLIQEERGYGGALLAGFRASAAAHILTMDADLSHPPSFVRDLWAQRDEADVVIASRYIAGGRADMPVARYVLSRTLNAFFSWGLGLAVHDLSSGFRLYRRRALEGLDIRARDFDVLQEILVRTHLAGGRVREVPFAYAPRKYGASNARVVAFGIAYLRTFAALRRLRASGRQAR